MEKINLKLDIDLKIVENILLFLKKGGQGFTHIQDSITARGFDISAWDLEFYLLHLEKLELIETDYFADDVVEYSYNKIEYSNLKRISKNASGRKELTFVLDKGLELGILKIIGVDKTGFIALKEKTVAENDFNWFDLRLHLLYLEKKNKISKAYLTNGSSTREYYLCF